MNKNKKIKVLCAMSGGVDSSVAAALLVKAGYDVTGAFMVNYDEREGLEIEKHNTHKHVCWVGDYQDALRVAAKLGIKLLRLDFTKEYKAAVLDYMYKEYEVGRTPNPDVLCNKYIKFGVWLDRAKELGFDYLATGHYAKVMRRGSRNVVSYALKVSRDENKDQTYFLHQLNQEQLRYTMFPVGEYTKPEIRKMAKQFELPTAEKEESMGICFVGEVKMKNFLSNKIKARPGKVVLSSGEMVGEHKGLPFYTIGERGLGVKTSINLPLYVVGKNGETNELMVGYENDPLLFKREIAVGEINWIKAEPKLPFDCDVRLRHRQPLQKCKVKKKGASVLVEFAQPQRAATPGQFAVFYKKGECLGGGVIL